MSPYILTTLLLALGLGTTITFASSHWLLAWMGLEINTLAILPLMAKNHHPRAIEATTKYFITQATAAAMLLFASTTNAWLSGQWDIQQLSNPLSISMLTIAIMLKIGLAPMHAWLPEVLQGLDLTTGLILTTWQKLAPFALLLQIQQTNPTIMIMFATMSIMVGGWGGLNQTQLRKILAYSSIAHLGWMVLIMQFSPTLTVLTLTIYIMTTFAAFITFKLNKSTNINMLTITWTKNPTLTALTPLILLSLGGLPPLTGFLPKWLILQELTKQNLTPMATIAALSALLSLYFYLRLSYSMTLTISPNNLTGITPWRLTTTQMTLPLSISITLTLLLLPMSPTITTIMMM
uniref:NADH-ubiquinone oxidoreductase chain 2 n=1 Tax=Ophichthys cuchia TaxID=2793285 RepID=A0A8E8U236_9TELE|nr:NADH dehydrogenase subunit 2 [Ophichthys cuchia]QWE36553.1 NADH dehydrogenase subunit 2 [Ophichthys cuchia]UZC55289.1 NADH dehydrogenase subunit 2 [Ophichthys cuchia]